ncbi:MAG: hypothetical protein ABIS28_14300 [Caldimonas sp.]
MPLTPEQRVFLETYLKVPKLAADAKKSDQKDAKKHDKSITAEYQAYLDLAARIDGDIRDYRRVLQETAETSADTANLVKYAKALDEAKVLATQKPQPDFKAAAAKLEAVRADAAIATQAARNRALEEAEFHPIYDNKVERIQTAQKALESRDGKPLPGAKAQHDELGALIAAGKVHADKGKYKDAYHALEGLSGTLKKGVVAEKSFRKHVGGEAFQKQRLLAEKALDDWQRAAGIAQAAAITAERNKFSAILAPLTLDHAEDSKEVKKALADMKSFADTIVKNTADLIKRAAEASILHDSLDKKVAALALMGTTAVFEPVQTSMRAARTKLGLQDYDGALADFQAIDKPLSTTYTALKTKYDKWTDLESTVSKISMPELDKLTGCSDAKIGVPASRWMTAFMVAQQEVLLTRDWDAAAKVASDLQADLPALSKDWAAWAKKNPDAAKRKAKAPPQEGLASAKQAVADLPPERQFNVLARQATTALGALGQEDAAKATALRDELDKLRPQTGTAADAKSVQKLQDLLTRIGAELERLAKATATATDAMNTRAEGLTKRVTKLRKSNEGFWSKEKNKQYEPFFAALALKVEDARALADSPLKAVVESAKAAFDAIETEIASLEAEAGNKASTASFDAMEAKMAALKKLLDDEKLKTCLPTKHGVLTFRLEKEVVPASRKLAPALALVELATFEADIRGQIKFAEEAAKQRATLIENATKRRTELDAVIGAPQLKAALLKRINEAMRPAEGGEPACAQELLAIEQTIKEVVATPELLASAEARTRQVDFEASLAKRKWDASIAVFKKDTAREAAAAAAEAAKTGSVNRSLYFHQLAPALKAAEKAAKAHDYDEANAKLTEAYRFANEFIDNPYSLKSASSQKLKDLRTQWRSAVGSLLGDLKQLKEAIAAEVKADPSVDAGNVNAMIDRVSGSFDPTAFDHVLITLSEDDPKVARRPLKEQGLRYLRSYQSMLAADPLLARIAEQTFHPVSLRGMRDTLTAIDFNLQSA